MMTRVGLLTILLCLMAQQNVLANDEETLKLYQELAAEQGNGGVVLELQRDANPGAQSTTTSSTSKASSNNTSSTRSTKSTGSKQIEMIVGGQGENGIAKRGELLVEE